MNVLSLNHAVVREDKHRRAPIHLEAENNNQQINYLIRLKTMNGTVLSLQGALLARDACAGS